MSSDAVIKMLGKNPLLRFSPYTQGQYLLLQRLGQQVLDCLETSVGSDPANPAHTQIDGKGFGNAYDLFWLWLIGAYEVVRTMHQAKRCFSEATHEKLRGLKSELASLRMPFAKQELERLKGQGDGPPVNAEPSVHHISKSPPDFLYEVRGQKISARGLIGKFAVVIGGITTSDILADHRTAYGTH